MNTECAMILSVISAILCGAMMVCTKGVHGIGWFLVLIIIIWGFVD